MDEEVPAPPLYAPPAPADWMGWPGCPPPILAYCGCVMRHYNSAFEWARLPDHITRLAGLMREACALRAAMRNEYDGSGMADQGESWLEACLALERAAIDYYRAAVGLDFVPQHEALMAAMRRFECKARAAVRYAAPAGRPEGAAARQPSVEPPAVMAAATTPALAEALAATAVAEGPAVIAAVVTPAADDPRAAEDEPVQEWHADGPGGPLEFWYVQRLTRFDKAERRHFKLLVAMFPLLRLRGTFTPEEVAEAYVAAGMSAANWSKLQEYAKELNTILGSRAALPSKLEWGADFLRWEMSPQV